MKEFEERLVTQFPAEQYKGRLCDLAGKLKISAVNEAYNYDKIKDYYCKTFKCKSADALLVDGNQISLIEFKTGFSYVGKQDPDYVKLKKEEQRLSIRMKACESLMLLEKVVACDISLDDYSKKYIAVIDSAQNSLDATVDFIKNKAKNQEVVSDRDVLREEMITSLLGYRKEIGGKKVFYDDVQVMYDYEFRI